jgi:hypothetical protein
MLEPLQLTTRKEGAVKLEPLQQITAGEGEGLLEPSQQFIAGGGDGSYSRNFASITRRWGGGAVPEPLHRFIARGRGGTLEPLQ